MGILGSKALDINVSTQGLCLILGYLAAPGRIGLIEAEIPSDMVSFFTTAYPGEPYRPITQGITSGGNVMKEGHQFRIYFNNINNCPTVLMPFLGQGRGTYVNRINRGKFIEKIIEQYGFHFGRTQNSNLIRSLVMRRHPSYIADFDAGMRL